MLSIEVTVCLNPTYRALTDLRPTLAFDVAPATSRVKTSRWGVEIAAEIVLIAILWPE
jgi:hypothetical protein